MMRQGTNRTSEDSLSNFSRYSDDVCAFNLKGAAEKERNMKLVASNLRTLMGRYWRRAHPFVPGVLLDRPLTYGEVESF